MARTREARVNGASAHALVSEDVGNIVSLEHVNVTIPDQAIATTFYVLGMGFTRDPYMNVGLNNMWINLGEQQFHLPTREPQVIPGHIGIVVPDLDALQARLRAVRDALAGTRFGFSIYDDYVAVTCPWGNQFRCYAPHPRFGDIVLGLPYVEFLTRPGTAAAIARFYDKVFHAPASVVRGSAGPAAHVRVGTFQELIFRETDQPLPPYDGHHIAIYVANFSGPYKALAARDLIMEEVRNHQFRFNTIADPASGEPVFTVEHEVRSMHHPMYHRPLVNRNPNQTLMGYRRGHDALVFTGA